MTLFQRPNYEQLVTDITTRYAAFARERVNSIVARLISKLNDGSDIEPPDQPQGVVATGGAGVATITWSTTPRAVRYTVLRALSSAPSATTVAGNTSGRSFTDVNLAAGTYLYTVIAFNVEDEASPVSDPAVAVVTGGSSGSPTTPGSFAVAMAGDNSAVEVTWAALAAGTVAVRIERALGATSTVFQTIASSVTGTQFDDIDIDERLTYRYRAFGIAQDGTESAATAIVNITVPSSDTTPPPVPENPTVTPGDGLIQLGWDAVSAEDLAGYQWAIGLSTGTYAQIRDVSSDTLGVTIPGLTNGTTYYFAVRSKDTSGNVSDWSVEVSGAPVAVGGGDTTPPAVPSNVTAVRTDSGQITVSWQENVETDLASYRVYTSVPPAGSSTGPWTLLATKAAGTSAHVQSGLTAIGVYYYYVTAVDTSGNESAPSIVVAAPIRTVEFGGGGGTAPVDPDTGGTGDDFGNSSSLGITAQYNVGSTVHGYAANSAEQNKLLFIPGMRAARTGRDTAFTAAGSVLASATQHIFENKRFRVSDGNQWFLNLARGADPLTSYNAPQILDNCRFGEVADLYASSDVKWTMRRYQVAGSITVDTDLIGRPRTASAPDPDSIIGVDDNGNPIYNQIESGEGPAWYPSQQEHFQYDSQWRSSVFLNNTADFIGGHFFYIAHREYDSDQYGPDNLPYVADNLVLISNCHASDTDQWAGRAGGAIQLFDLGNLSFQGTIIIRNSSIVQRFPYRFDGGGNLFDPADVRPNTYRSRGVLDVTQYDFCEDPPKAGHPDAPGIRTNPGTYDTATDPHVVDTLLIQNCLFDVTEADRPMHGIEGVNNVIYENCLFIRRDGGNGHLFFNENRPSTGLTGRRGCKPCGTVTMRNCKQVGNVTMNFRQADGSLVTSTVGVNSEGREVVYNGSTGAITSNTAWDPTTDATDPAPLINALNPFSGATMSGYTIPWGITGVSV